MQTLSYGYKKPEPGDTGDSFYPAMSDNMQSVNDHTHNGTNSAPLDAGGVTVSSGSWGAVGGLPGIYEQVVTLPTGFTFANVTIWFVDTSEKVINLEYQYDSTNSFKVFTNDNSQEYTARFK